MDSNMIDRNEFEFPLCIEDWGWKYHHMGVPTQEKRAGEIYLSSLKFYVSGFPNSPFGVEWMRFEDDCDLHPLIREKPHLAFVVDDLDKELSIRGLKILSEPGSPMGGVRVAMVEHDGAPIELMEFTE